MSRCMTVAQIKHQGGKPLRGVPREGSDLRALFDLLIESKGVPIECALTKIMQKASIARLQDFYGLDIRCIRKGRWVLAGEWFGRVYVASQSERVSA